jgi:hypothetical protein
LDDANAIQLITNARYKTGAVKTAYVYVPSWFTGRRPSIAINRRAPACLAKGELSVGLVGTLPLVNYWRDWNLVLLKPGSPTVVARLNDLEFQPDNGRFSFNNAKPGNALPSNGQMLDATLTGKFGFEDVGVPPFKVALSTNESLIDRVGGLESLVSGEHAKLRIATPESAACIQQMQLLVGGKTIAVSNGEAPSELSIDLGKIDSGPATLEIQQYESPIQALAVFIKKRRAHVQRIVHFDLETDISVNGDNLDRIDSIRLGQLVCRSANDSGEQASATTLVFSCPKEIAANSNFPAQVTVTHQENEPSSFDFPVTKIGARPHMTIEGSKQALVTTLSAKAMQWNLNVDDPYVTEDSGLAILLHAFAGYRLSHGPYVLQLKFADDPQTEQKPIIVPMLSDLSHNELRTRSPITFNNVLLPSIVNPIWYRIQHQPSGLVGDWQPLNRSIVSFPQLGSVSCEESGGLLIHGNQLEQVDWVSRDLTRTSPPPQTDANPNGVLTRCDKGLCLGIDAIDSGNRIRVKVHWIDDRLFDVTIPNFPNCAATR